MVEIVAGGADVPAAADGTVDAAGAVDAAGEADVIAGAADRAGDGTRSSATDCQACIGGHGASRGLFVLQCSVYCVNPYAAVAAFFRAIAHDPFRHNGSHEIIRGLAAAADRCFQIL